MSRSPRWKGDVAIRKADREVILILSALLMEEERRLLKVKHYDLVCDTQCCAVS